MVRCTSFSGRGGTGLSSTVSCKFCPHPYESCIGSSRTEIVSITTAGRQPAHRPVTQDAGAAPHDDKRPTRFVSRGLKYSLFLASVTLCSLPNPWGDKLKSPPYLGHFFNVTPCYESISICHPPNTGVLENVTPQNPLFLFKVVPPLYGPKHMLLL